MGQIVNSLLGLEGEPHRRLRSLVSKAFTPRASARLHDTIVEVINELIDHIAAEGHCDIVTDIARPYPVPIICALLGAPREDWQLFALWADDIFTAFTLNPDGIDEGLVMRAWGELDAYVDDMVARRRDTLTDDLLSDLIRAEDDGDRLNADELRMLAAGLLLAGTDTTRNQLAASVDVLVDHPDQWALLARASRTGASAVEETMRHSPIACGTMRIVPKTQSSPAFCSPPEPWCSPIPLPPTAIQPSTTTPTASTSARRRTGRPDLRRRHPLLPRRQPGPARTLRGPEDPDPPDPSPSRSGPAPWKPMLGLSGPTTLPIEFSHA